MPPGVRFAQVKQVHGKAIAAIAPRAAVAPRPEADGRVPRSLSGCKSHAGRRVTRAGIVGASVRAMVRQGAEASAISALLGPSIGPCCFEVDDELARRFERRFERAHAHVHPSDRAGKAYLDLRGVIADQLALAGLRPAEIRKVGPCTKCESDRYFSRRAAGGSVTGLQLSFVGRFAT
jgi:copper oxidase (laccase) domain-containing protein